MSSSEIPLAAFGGWPLIILLVLAVVFAVAACRAASLADDRIEAFRTRELELDVIDLTFHEGEIVGLGSWTFFDWRVDAPELVE